MRVSERDDTIDEGTDREDMTDTTELDDLAGVTQHPGWYRIRQLLANEWGPAGSRYVQGLERVANDADPAKAATNMQMVMMVRKEIETFFAGVESRVRQLQHAGDAAKSPSRRGML